MRHAGAAFRLQHWLCYGIVGHGREQADLLSRQLADVKKKWQQRLYILLPCSRMAELRCCVLLRRVVKFFHFIVIGKGLRVEMHWQD